jgi:hypothetical protein
MRHIVLVQGLRARQWDFARNSILSAECMELTARSRNADLTRQILSTVLSSMTDGAQAPKSCSGGNSNEF